MRNTTWNYREIQKTSGANTTRNYREIQKISGANTIGNVRVGATRPQLTFLPTPQLNCALHQKQIRVDESTTNGKTENILLLVVLRIYFLPTVNSVHYDIDFSRKKHSVSALHQDLQ